MSDSTVILRYYQRDAIHAQEWAWEEYPRTIIKMPTGAGKTVVASILTGNKLPGRTLFLADQEELCDQPIRVFKRISGIYAAVERGKDRASLEAPVVIGSSQTFARKKRIERFPRDHFQRIIIDEAHRGTERDIEICDYFEGAQVCGITATPFRQNLADLSKWYGTVAYKMEPLNFIEAGFAPQERILTLPVEINLEGVKTGMTSEGKDYKPQESAHAIEPYFEVVADLIKQHAEGRFGIAYLPLIETSKNFAAILRQHGITAQHVDGGSADRDLIIEGFARGEFSWLCNAGVVSTGVDIPRADAFLCLRPTRSASWYQQARGRTWRVLPGVIDSLPERDQAEERRNRIAWSDKPDVLLFDLLWQNDELGVCRPGDMYAESQYDARQIFEKIKREADPMLAMEVAQRVQEEREQAVIRALEKAALKASGNAIKAEHVGAIIGDTELANYSPIAAWEMKPVSDGQKRALKNYGIDPDGVPNMGMAGKILGALAFRIRMGLATLKQVRLIKSHNARQAEHNQIAHPEGLTFDEASRAISLILGK